MITHHIYMVAHIISFMNSCQVSGIEVTFCDPSDFNLIRDSVRKNTKVIYAESMGNPELNPIDIKIFVRELPMKMIFHS